MEYISVPIDRQLPVKFRLTYLAYSHQDGGITSEHWLPDIVFYLFFTM